MKISKVISWILPGMIFSVTVVFPQKFAKKPAAVSEILISRQADQSFINRFYRLNQQHLFWFAAGAQARNLRQSLRTCIDSSVNIGLERASYYYSALVERINDSFPPEDSTAAMRTDKLFTNAAILFCRDVYQGSTISSLINADEISPKYAEKDDDRILKGLLSAKTGKNLFDFIDSLQPVEKEYGLLKTALAEKLQKGDPAEIKQLTTTLNLFRWIHHFRLDKYIVVNIPSATLSYYENDSAKLKMKVVVGKPSTRTPRFAAYCNQIILYPYWNVPRKIVVDELLPLFKKSPKMVDGMNMQVIGSQGKIIDPATIDWSLYNKNNFPYQIRQSTGCDNSLGVIKFNLTSPYDVYLHDTNFKLAFLSRHRYLSHGCIRVEKPVALAGYLLGSPLDSNFLASCLKNQSPVPVELSRRVPVFVLYMSAEADNAGEVNYFSDVYHLLK